MAEEAADPCEQGPERALEPERDTRRGDLPPIAVHQHAEEQQRPRDSGLGNPEPAVAREREVVAEVAAELERRSNRDVQLRFLPRGGETVLRLPDDRLALSG